MPNLEFKPTSVSPPGESLCDLLGEKGISQKLLSLRLGRSGKNLSQIVNGKAPITPELALDLERVLGTPARFWLAREARYQEWLSRSSVPDPTEADLEWARSFTYPKMAEYGWVPATPNAREKFFHLLSFFGVVSRPAFVAWAANLSPQYRRSEGNPDKDHLIAAWLRRGELEAEEVDAGSYDEGGFGDAVDHARTLTCASPIEFVPVLKMAFARCGVVLLFVPELPSMGVSGATRWLTPSKALIQITLRYRTNDHLWFTIFHESCHILRHQKRAVYLETNGEKSPDELVADAFAANHMIPASAFRKFVGAGMFDRASVEAFAESIGISPAVVVGRLQREGLVPWQSPLNSLKVKFQWTTES
ncbi:MAG: helix-turn-helix domain-containing protein [Fimbriimonadaceae bacterium]